MEKILEELEALELFKAFFYAPCEICHELVEEWDDYNVKIGYSRHWLWAYIVLEK